MTEIDKLAFALNQFAGLSEEDFKLSSDLWLHKNYKNGAPPKNVVAPFSTIKIVWPVVNFFKGNSPFLGTKDWYHRAFFNNYSQEESD